MPAADKRERVTHIYKASADVRVGISLQKDSAPIFIGEGTEAHRNGLLPPVVRGVNPGGLAAQAGLQVGDMIVQINREKAISNLSAAAMLREAEGDIEVRFLPRLYVLGPEMDAARTAPVAPLDLSGVHNDARPGEAGGGDYTSRFFAEANRCVQGRTRPFCARPTACSEEPHCPYSRAQAIRGDFAADFAQPRPRAKARRAEAAAAGHAAQRRRRAERDDLIALRQGQGQERHAVADRLPCPPREAAARDAPVGGHHAAGGRAWQGCAQAGG